MFLWRNKQNDLDFHKIANLIKLLSGKLLRINNIIISYFQNFSKKSKGSFSRMMDVDNVKVFRTINFNQLFTPCVGLKTSELIHSFYFSLELLPFVQYASHLAGQ